MSICPNYSPRQDGYCDLLSWIPMCEKSRHCKERECRLSGTIPVGPDDQRPSPWRFREYSSTPQLGSHVFSLSLRTQPDHLTFRRRSSTRCFTRTPTCAKQSRYTEEQDGREHLCRLSSSRHLSASLTPGEIKHHERTTQPVTRMLTQIRRKTFSPTLPVLSLSAIIIGTKKGGYRTE